MALGWKNQYQFFIAGYVVAVHVACRLMLQLFSSQNYMNFLDKSRFYDENINMLMRALVV